MPEVTTKTHEVIVRVHGATHRAAADVVADRFAGEDVSVEIVTLYPTCKTCIAERTMNTEVNGVLTPPEVPHMGESRERAMELAISHHAACGTGGISQVIKAADAIQTYLATGTVPEDGNG